MMLRVRSACKINLTLDVLSLRADGYHELQSVVSMVGWYDELEFHFGAPGLAHGELALACDQVVLQTPDNLVLRALRAWQEAAQQVAGCRITLRKQIPMGAGLGGGSANAAATLLAINRANGSPLSPAELETIAATLGADVPLFLRAAGASGNGTLLLEGIGERLSPLPALHGWVVIAQPEAGLSTPAIYRRFDEMQIISRRDTPAMLEALQIPDGVQRLREVAALVGNDLTAPAKALGAPVDELCGLLREAGALGASMTGSGSAVFGLFEDEAGARKAAKLLRIRESANFAAIAPLGVEGVTFH